MEVLINKIKIYIILNIYDSEKLFEKRRGKLPAQYTTFLAIGSAGTTGAAASAVEDVATMSAICIMQTRA